MKFHGIAMVGPFVNQKLVSLPDPFDLARDPGRLVWLTDGTLWYGTDEKWETFGGTGDANEVEDMYSDLLRTTIFLNAAYDEFALDPDDDILVESTTMTHDRKEKEYTYIVGQYIESTNLYDPESDASFIGHVLPSVDYVDGAANSTPPTIEVTTNGVNWFEATSNKVLVIPNASAGVDLRMRFTAGDTGVLKSWGLLYNKDLTAACTKWGLTHQDFEAVEGQTVIEYNYTVGSVQVFLNGDLLSGTDFDASTGTEIVFYLPLHAGDIVYITTFSTSILDQHPDLSAYIRHDGTVTFTNEQSMGDNRLIGLADGVDGTDAVNLNQLNAIDHSGYIKKDGSVTYTGNQPMGNQKLTGLAAGSSSTDSINKGQLDSLASTVSTNTSNITTNSTNISTNAGTIGQLWNGNVLNASLSYAQGDIHGGELVYGNTTGCYVNAFSCISDVGDPATRIYTTGQSWCPSSLAGTGIRHIFAVKYDTGVMGVYSGTSVDGAGLPANVTHKRWLGFTAHYASQIKLFTMKGNVIQFSAESQAAIANITQTPVAINHTPFIPVERTKTVTYGAGSVSVNCGFISYLHGYESPAIAGNHATPVAYGSWGNAYQTEVTYDASRVFRVNVSVGTLEVLLHAVTLIR